MAKIKSESVGTTKFILKYDPNWEEYRVTVTEAGKLNDARAYFTDDKEDAQGTMEAMVEEEKKYQQFKKGE